MKLFLNQVDQLQRYSDISGYKDGVVGREVKPYLDDFGGTVKQEKLMIGKMTLEQVEVSHMPIIASYSCERDFHSVFISIINGSFTM